MEKKTSLYQVAYEHLLNQIEKGVYIVGSKLPPETNLAKELNVSMITIRRAMQELASEGWVERQAGRGTFVTTPNRIDQSVTALTSFTADMERVGIVPSSDIAAQNIIKADEKQASILKVEVDSLLFHLERVRRGDGVPLILEDSYIPVSYCPNLTKHDYSSKSLYEVLTMNGLELTRSVQVFEPIVLSEYQAELLNVASGSPAFMRDALSYKGDTPIEWGRSIYRKDRSRFIVETGSYKPIIVIDHNHKGDQ
jgi:GntR family transcriptional regulator